MHYANPYGISELSTSSANLFFKSKVIDYGLAISQFGYEKYNESRLSVNVSKKLSTKLSLGVRLNYFSMLMATEEGRKSTMSSDIGFLVVAIPRLTIGMIARNLIRTSYTTTRGEFELPLTLRLGANYHLIKELLLITEIEKDEISDPILKVGCEYLPLEEVALRMGLLNNPIRPTFGVGYNPGRFAFDVSSIYHTVLGFHTELSLQYKF